MPRQSPADATGNQTGHPKSHNSHYTQLGLDDPSLFIQKGIIDGQFVDAKDGATFDVYDPASGKVIGTCPEMTVEDTRRAVDVASKTFKGDWAKTTIIERQKMLIRLHELLMANANDIARLIVWENGKSWTDAYGEVLYSASYVQWFAGEAVRQYGDVVPSAIPGQRNFTIKQPVGVAALLVPWNFPAGEHFWHRTLVAAVADVPLQV